MVAYTAVVHSIVGARGRAVHGGSLLIRGEKGAGARDQVRVCTREQVSK